MKNKKNFKFLISIVFLFGVTLSSFTAQAAQAANDNDIWWGGVFHYQDGIHMNPLFPTVNGSVTVILRVNKDDITAAKIRYWAGGEYFVDMVWDHDDTEYSYWKGTIPASTGQIYYRFKLIDGTDVDWHSSKGMSDEEPFEGDFTYFPVGGTSAFEAPDWVKNAVFYQIFPERFYNGSVSNDPPETVPWGSEPTTKNFMGGDLQGIIDKLDYLNDGNPATTNDLGITAIYLNPIFESRTNHKYSTEDYENVDDNFGDNALFSILITEAHKRGIKVILDGVFNHTGVAHPFFDDVVKNGESSPYYKFYTIYKWPIRWYDDLNGNGKKDDSEPYFYHWSETTDDEYLRTTDYDAWWGFAHLPNLVTTEKEIRDYFINDPDSIAVRWLDIGIDGWRLDVANEIEDDFWKAFRTRLKAVNPNAYIVGEFWGSASKWLDGTMWDSTMNYRFRSAVQNFFAGIDDDGNVSQTTVDEFDSALYAIRSDYCEAAHSTAMNLIDSHDTWRFINRCGEDWAKLRAAVIFQMTYAGAPTIYYGTENGMPQWPGARKDPGNRSAMEWGNYTNPNHDKINELYRKLIRIRLSHPALRSPHVRTLYRHNLDNVYAYARHCPNETLIVVINNSSSPKNAEIELYGLFPDAIELVDQLNGGSCTVISGKLMVNNINTKNGCILAVSGPDYSNIVINEFLPAPSRGNSEWVELYNKGASTVDLGGCKIDDIIGGGTSPYRIPKGTTIGGNGFRAFGRTFGLNNTGDTVNLIDPEGKIIDSYKYTSNPGRNKSIGRLPDGADNWEVFDKPTKNTKNKKEEPTSYGDIVINEFLPAPSRDNSEWVELYNKGALTVDLGGCKIDDIIGGGTSPYRIPNGTTIGRNTYLLFGRTFGLNNTGDTVSLIDPGGKVIDSYKYTSNPGRNKSIGRLPDGASTWGILVTATPGGPNAYFANIPPTADFTFTPSSPKVSQATNFDGSRSADSDGTIVKYEWDWENDGTFDATGEMSTHKYTSDGTYKVTLRVTDNDGAKDKISKDLTVTSGETSDEFYGTTNKFAEENIYFVMTDRFVNGDTENDHRDQGTSSGNPTWEIRMDGPGGQYANIGYMGGDFEGIYNNADYIKEMGFTSIWITPIIDNPDEAFTGGQPCSYGAGIGSDGGKTGYHGYWGVNFYKVDEHSESNGFSFAEFASKMLNDHGLKIVLDIVCNHGSPSFTMPYDQPKFGEIYDKSNTLFADHQNLDPGSLDYSNPLHKFYNKGGGLAQLSDLNETNPDVLDYLVGAYLQWIDQGAYAFRIDTIAWMPHSFWKAFADRIRENRPDFFMFGENFNYNASTIAQHQKPENGGISVLDFPGKAAINSVFSGGGSYSSLEGYLHLIDGTYTSPYELVTFYDNHDMARMNANENGFIDANNWLFTTRGIPCLYYGSEKRFMAGKSEHQGNRNYYGTENIADARTIAVFQRLRKIANIRKNSPALQKGLQVNISLGSNTASFYRAFQYNGVNQTALVLLNKGDSSAAFTITKYMNNGTWIDAYSGDAYNVTSNELSTSVPPHDVKVLLLNNPVNNEEFITLLKALMNMSGERVEIDPSPATAGMDVKVFYRARADQEIECHWGINNWSGTGTPQGDIPMTWKTEKFVYECVIPVPPDATMLDMVFHNITTGAWDNNDGADWHFEVE